MSKKLGFGKIPVGSYKNGLVTLAPFLLHERKVFSVERFWPFQKARTCSMNSIISVSLKLINRTRFPAKRRES